MKNTKGDSHKQRDSEDTQTGLGGSKRESAQASNEMDGLFLAVPEPLADAYRNKYQKVRIVNNNGERLENETANIDNAVKTICLALDQTITRATEGDTVMSENDEKQGLVPSTELKGVAEAWTILKWAMKLIIGYSN